MNSSEYKKDWDTSDSNIWTPVALDPVYKDLVPFSDEEALAFFEMHSQMFTVQSAAQSSSDAPKSFDRTMQAPLKTGLSPIPTNELEENISSNSLVCPWDGCKRQQAFSTKGTLDRHIQTQHVAPRSFKCPQVGCNRSFSRRDNLNQHRRSVHLHVIHKGDPI